jgi:hypothetical protein
MQTAGASKAADLIVSHLSIMEPKPLLWQLICEQTLFERIDYELG